MKDVMKDEDLEKVSGGWSIAKLSNGNILIQSLTGSQPEALRNLSKELGLNWFFADDTIHNNYPRIKTNGRRALRKDSVDIIYNGNGFNDEIFAKIKQVLGEPNRVSGL